jgi:hypothetical protein
MIGKNIKSDNVIVTIQADFDDNLGMKRYILTQNGSIVTSIENENSASIRTYKQYLEWVKAEIEYKKIAIVFLDHGGKLDEICLDEKPVYEFLKVNELKNVFSEVFDKNNVDLLFLQVCTKGVIEPLYEFKDIAKYTLCSQVELGAPNYYYAGLFIALSNQSVNTGYEVAEIIVQN